MSSFIAIIFIGVAVSFILGIKLLGSPKTARLGNLVAAFGMLVALIEEFWDKKEKTFVLKLDDEIIKGCLVTHGGKIVNEKLIAKPN